MNDPAAIATTDGVETEKRLASVCVSHKPGEEEVVFDEALLPRNEQRANVGSIVLPRNWDPNLSDDAFDAISLINVGNVEAADLVAPEYIENSPYPEVRAAVRNYDEAVPANTFRAWFIGLTLTTVGAGLNMLFSLRAPTITITPYVVQLVAYPIGVALARVLPHRQFNIWGWKWSLNPGPFNIKEHTIIVVMANASFGGGAGYFTDVLVAQRQFYGQNFGWAFNILLALSTQVAGFGMAGLTRKLLVEPASMIWPASLVNTAFMYALHDHSKSDPARTHGWSISRYRLFLVVFAGAFCWYWIPGFLFQALSAFAFVTWIRPNNVVINQLFGQTTGLSLIPITFDWTQITGYTGSPLIPPWHAIANTLIGTVLFFGIATIGIHYSGAFYAAYLPISDSNSYDNTQGLYNVSNILSPNLTLDVAKYQAYSPLFLSTTFIMAYGMSFAAISAVIVHTTLFHGREIWIRLRAEHEVADDIHTRMMKKYPLVPAWWYGGLFVAVLTMSFGLIYGWSTHLPGWGLLIAFVISTVWLVPIGMIQAITNVQIGLNVFTEFLVGYMLPGKPIAMMLFKTFGYISMLQALYFLQDLKLGHYVKVPQRPMFCAQVFATIWSCFVQLAVLEWSLDNISDICTKHQANHFSCPSGRVFFYASVIWGCIGPKRIFSPGAMYASMQWFWLVGVITPVAIYLAARRFPKTSIRFLNAPVIFSGAANIPPATPLNYLSFAIVGWIFQKYIRNRYRGWWQRYNYIISAGLDVGLAISTIVIIAALNLTNSKAPSWWGNVRALNTTDYNGNAIQTTLPAGQTFGPTPGGW